MRISYLFIRNFKSVQYLAMKDLEHALILVGKNSTGKTVILDALLAVAGIYKVSGSDFKKNHANIEIGMTLELDDNDLHRMNENGVLSRYKDFERWLTEFKKKLPAYQDHQLSFIWTMNHDGVIRFQDSCEKDNKNIAAILPRFFYLDHNRDLSELQEDLYLSFCSDELTAIKDNHCIFDATKPCHECFQCIGSIEQKSPLELSIPELVRLTQYRLSHESHSSFTEKLDDNFYKNSGYSRHLKAEYRLNLDSMFTPDISVLGMDGTFNTRFEDMSTGMKSLYVLSLLESYVEENKNIPFVILIEDPELFLHPQLQKNACEILSRLSKKNQVIFSTHSPNMLFNFNTRQIRQVMLDASNNTTVNEHTDIDYILNDLGYTANDLLNVSFVFFVEGKQDRSRLPLLLNKYYSEIQDEKGNPKRISIITTNSCTNIKTYANLKYMNQLYIKDSFLMIRDGDGKDSDQLRASLCNYYKGREIDDRGYLPRVMPRNVLILKYYSFENYFLFPEIMVQIGVVESVEAFYTTLYEKYEEYLKNLSSVKNMMEHCPFNVSGPEDLMLHMEEIRTYVRGHNLYNIFYARYKGDLEEKILTKYIEAAPRAVFADILQAIDHFVYFDNHKK